MKKTKNTKMKRTPKMKPACVMQEGQCITIKRARNYRVASKHLTEFGATKTKRDNGDVCLMFGSRKKAEAALTAMLVDGKLGGKNRCFDDAVWVADAMQPK